VPDDFMIEPVSAEPSPQEKATGEPSEDRSLATLRYANKESTRNLSITPSLEKKLKVAVGAVFGEGHTVEIYSGGQARGRSHGTRGTRRHNDKGEGGRAADVYVYDPQGKRVSDRRKLMSLGLGWVASGYGSFGRFMKDGGIHLDEFTKDKLLPGEALTWRY
jgi:hypothetical protein